MMLKRRRGLVGKEIIVIGIGSLFVLISLLGAIFGGTPADSVPGKLDIQPAMDRYVADQHRPVADVVKFFGLTPSGPTKIEVLHTECSSMNKDHVSTCAVSVHAQGSDQVSHMTLNVLHHDATKTTPAGWEVLNVTPQASSAN